MKNKVLLVFPLILVLLLLVSCNKDQKAVKTLSGSWLLVKLDGQEVLTNTENEVVFTFDNCKLKKDEYCQLTTSNFVLNSNVGDVETMSYKVADDGETLIQRIPIEGQGINLEIPYNIIELTDNSLRMEVKIDGFEASLEFEKR